MLKKNFLFLGLVVLLCGVLATGCSPKKEEPTPPPVVVEDYVVGDAFSGENAENYWGPYGNGSFVLEGGAIVFDTSVADAWLTLNFKEDPNPVDKYKYVVITLKADNPSDAANAHMKLGNLGMSFTDWGITLSTDYTAYVVDLVAKGVTAWGDASQGQPDFALNKVGAVSAKIYVDKIVLTNNPPAQ